MKLHAYQSSGIRRINAEFRRGVKRVLAVAPTGAGKGTMATEMMRRAAKAGERVLFLVHRREIVTDIVERLEAVGCDMRRVTVETVQTLANRKRQTFDLVIADEAHHYRAEDWQAVLEGTGKKARVIGFTATPQRGDGKAMGDVFDVIVDVVSYSALLAMEPSPIVPCRVLTSPHPLDGALALHSVDAYQRYAKGTTALVFERDAKAARESLRAFKAAGITAELIVDSTTGEQRALAFERLRSGKTKALINVYVLTEGVDLPWVHTIVLARPCKHAGTYMQIVGRALRAAPRKGSALLIDLGGASYLHGSPTTDRTYSLEGRAMGERTGERVPVERGEPKGVLGLELVEFNAELRDRHSRQVRTGAYDRRMDWSAEDALGVETDRGLAGKHGYSRSAVAAARKRLGIGASHKQKNWDAEKRLGKMKDDDLAGLVGCVRSVVQRARQERGIAPFSPRYRGIDWDDISHRFGNETDAAIAISLGCHKNAVRDQRIRRGILSRTAQAAE